jgi:hypothetical protein
MARESLGLTRSTVMLPPKHITFLKKLAKQRGTTSAELIRLSIHNFITAEIHRIKSEKSHASSDSAASGDST